MPSRRDELMDNLQPVPNVYDSQTFSEIPGLHPRVHAKRLDRCFGYKIGRIETKLNQKYQSYDKMVERGNLKQHYQGTQTWIGLHPQVLQTPYSDILNCLESLRDCSVTTVVDIGSGYGRVGLVMNAVFPEAKFLGVEVLKKRAREGNRVFERLGLKNCRMIEQNVLANDYQIPQAQIYFIYDFSEADDICQVLDILQSRMREKTFYLITRGERVDFLLEKKYKSFWRGRGFKAFNDLKVYCCESTETPPNLI